MKQFKKIIALILVLTCVTLLGCTAEDLLGVFLNPTPQPYSGISLEDMSGARLTAVESIDAKNYNVYEMKLQLHPDTKQLDGAQKTRYVNNTGEALDKLYFHLYPNSFSDEGDVPFSAEEFLSAYPNGFSKSSIDILSLKAGGVAANFNLLNKHKDIMEIILSQPIDPGGSTDIEINYTVLLPNCLGRYGYGDWTYNLCNFYPIASVYDGQGWHNEPYYGIGDPFYSDMANYSVELTLPASFLVASTGLQDKPAITDDMQTISIVAENVRDFAMVASEYFEVDQKKVDDIIVSSYYLEDRNGRADELAKAAYGENATELQKKELTTYLDKKAGKMALDYGGKAIKSFNRRIGKYPYDQFSIVQTDFFIGGMEYPNLVLIDKSLYSNINPTMLELVTAHETAHQWWYGMVGNNEILHPWLDESLTEYTTLNYYLDTYNLNKRTQMNSLYFKGTLDYYVSSGVINPNGDNHILNRATNEYDNMYQYDGLAYDYGCCMFMDLETGLGMDVMTEALKLYFEKYKFTNSTPDALISAVTVSSGKDVRPFFETWLSGKMLSAAEFPE